MPITKPKFVLAAATFVAPVPPFAIATVPIRVPASAVEVIVISALPSNATPLMFLAVANLVAIAALPFEFNFKSNAAFVAVEIGLAASVVLSAEPNPTIDFVIPATVPVKIGEAVRA